MTQLNIMKIRIALLQTLLLTSILLMNPQTTSASGPNPVLVDGTYRIKIVSSQWKFIAKDLNSFSRLLN